MKLWHSQEQGKLYRNTSYLVSVQKIMAQFEIRMFSLVRKFVTFIDTSWQWRHLASLLFWKIFGGFQNRSHTAKCWQTYSKSIINKTLIGFHKYLFKILQYKPKLLTRISKKLTSTKLANVHHYQNFMFGCKNRLWPISSTSCMQQSQITQNSEF